MMKTTIKTYSELIKLDTFEERFNYLSLKGRVGQETFGYDRYLNQVFYRSKEWKRFRNEIIIRDNGCDLALEGHDIYSNIIIHHINPITLRDIDDRSYSLFDPENVVCVTHNTHNAIHYGDINLLVTEPITRSPGDTCLWKRKEY